MSDGIPFSRADQLADRQVRTDLAYYGPQVARHRADAAAITKDRDAAIRRAVALGWSHARIAAAIPPVVVDGKTVPSITRGRVGQIAQRRP